MAADLIGERVLRGSSMGSSRFRVDMPYYCDLYFDAMTSARIGLDDLNDAFDVVRAGAEGRRIVVFDDE